MKKFIVTEDTINEIVDCFKNKLCEKEFSEIPQETIKDAVEILNGLVEDSEEKKNDENSEESDDNSLEVDKICDEEVDTIIG